MNVKLIISIEFLESLIELPKNIQEKVIEFFPKFMNNPKSPGINFEPINMVNSKQLYSVRIDLNYRGIMYKDNQTNAFHLLWVEHHNEVYENVDLKKDIKSGNIPVYGKESYDILGISRSKSTSLFSSFSNKELLSFGLEERHLPLIRSLKNIESLQEIKEILPNNVYSNLELSAFKIRVNEIISTENAYKKELINLLKKEVLLPGLESNLEQDIKDSIQNTIDRIESKKSIMEIIQFYNDALLSIRGRSIRTKLNENNLLAFEDIVPKVRDIVNKINKI
jgi:mRNA-degrading endonuclease RelE of RelBE toxin-antitoxin system